MPKGCCPFTFAFRVMFSRTDPESVELKTIPGGWKKSPVRVFVLAVFITFTAAILDNVMAIIPNSPPLIDFISRTAKNAGVVVAILKLPIDRPPNLGLWVIAGVVLTTVAYSVMT